MAFIQFKKCLTDPKQLLKLVLLVVCVCITIYQLSQCILKLMHPPVSTYYNFELNETIIFPHITICRQEPYKTVLFPNYGLKSSIQITTKEFSDLFPFNTSTISQFLEDVTYTRSENIVFYSFQGDTFLSGQTETAYIIEENYFLTYGRCQTFIPLKLYNTSASNVQSVFYLKHDRSEKVKQFYSLSNVFGYRIFLHHSNEFPWGEQNEQSNFIDTLFLETNEEIQVSINVETFNQISTKDRPCNADPNYSLSKCQDTCIHNYIAKQQGCTLPWLRNLNDTYPECNTTDQVHNIISGLQSKRATILKNCVCLKSCNTTFFSTKINSRRDLDSSTLIFSNVAFTYSNNVVKSMTEVISYNLNTFISEIGGSLGFLLGLSVLGTVAVIEDIIKMFCCDKLKSEKKKEDKNQSEISDNSSDITIDKSTGSRKDFKNFVDFSSFYENFEKNEPGKEIINKY